jgi:hypothetical protein
MNAAQQALDEWVADYNTARPHQSLQMATPAGRFRAGPPPAAPSTSTTARTDRTGAGWISRRVCANGVFWQQVSVGRHHLGARCDVHVDGELIRFWIGHGLVKTAARTSRGEVQNQRPCTPHRPNP